MNKNLAAKAEMIESILNLKKNYGFSVVHLYDELKNLPKECSVIVQHDGNEVKVYDKNDISGQISFMYRGPNHEHE